MGRVSSYYWFLKVNVLFVKMLKVKFWLRASCFFYYKRYCVFVYMFRKQVKGNPEDGMFCSRYFRDLYKQLCAICFCFPVLLYYSKTCKIYFVRDCEICNCDSL